MFFKGVSLLLGAAVGVAFVSRVAKNFQDYYSFFIFWPLQELGNVINVYNGIPCTEIDLDGLRARIGFVTQDTQLFSGTIRENLLFVNPTASDAECLDVLRKAACDHLLARADRGLDMVIGEGGVPTSSSSTKPPHRSTR